MKKIKSFEEACIITGDPTEIPSFEGVKESRRKSMAAQYKAEIIIEAINSDNPINQSDFNQRKYELWMWLNKDESKPSALGLSFSACAYWRSSTGLGSRLFFTDSDAPKYFFDTFPDLCEALAII